MRVVIVGAGATGGFLGAHLARSGEDVTLVARGPNLVALRSSGLTVRGAETDFTTHPDCTDDLGAVGAADVVFLTVKAQALTQIAGRLGEALTPDTVVVAAQNGIPWWYFLGSGGALEGTRLESVDPGGVIAASLPIKQVVGCVVYPATTLIAPGVVEHVEGDRFSLGEPDGSRSARCIALAAMLTRAGLRGRVQPRLRAEIWLKLLGNATLNPISALTRSSLAVLTRDDRTRTVLRSLMQEVDTVARAVGIVAEVSIDHRLAGAAQVGEHRTSMLQDVESGRPLEVESLLGSVVELAGVLGVSTPGLTQLYALTLALDRSVRGG